MKTTPQIILDDPRFLYTTRPGDGRTKYVFQDKVCIGLAEALDHVTPDPVMHQDPEHHRTTAQQKGTPHVRTGEPGE